MSPEFYAIIGVGVSTIGVLSGLMIFLFSHLNRRIDRLEARVDRLEDTTVQRMDRLEDATAQRMNRLEDTMTQRMNRLEDKFDWLVEQFERLREQVSDLAKRVAKLEWMFERQFGNRPQPPDNDED